MRRWLRTGLLCLTAATTAQAADVPTGALVGRILEQGTKRAIAGGQVLLAPVGQTAVSDETGAFRLDALPPGEYVVSVAAVNFRPLQPAAVRIEPGREFELTLYLEPEPIALLEIVVETERKPADPARQTLNKREIERIPGTAGDLITAVQNLPGVIGASAVGGDFLARGSGPLDNTVLLDDVPVFLTFHAGGFISTISTDLIRSVDFFAGGFGARYGNAMGAVLDITSREPETDRVRGRANLSPVLIEGRIEGPAGADRGFFVAARRGLLEFLPLPTDEGTTVVPVFNDYQAKFTYAPPGRHALSLLVFGSHDAFRFETDDPDPRDPILSSLDLDLDFHDQAVTLRSDLGGGRRTTVTLLNSYTTQRFTVGPDLFSDFTSDQVRLRSHFVAEHPAGRPHTLAAGLEVGQAWYTIDTRFARLCHEGEPDCNLTDAPRVEADFSDTAWGADGYLQDTLHLTPRFDLTLGGRLDYFDPTRDFTLSPRLAALWKIDARQRLKAAFGRYYQWPDRLGEFIEGWGNPAIDSSLATHYVAGYERAITPAVDFDLQIYHKTLERLIVSAADPDKRYENAGVGVATGAELLLRRRLTDRFFGWLAYGYSVTRRRNHPGEDWRRSDYDRPHAVTAIASYQWTPRWNVGGRWRFTSGAPYTPIVDTVCSATDPTDCRAVYDDEINSRRLPPSHRLDLRVERKTVYDTWVLTAYLEIWNVYNRRNPVGLDYSDDFRERDFATEPGMIPFFGVTAEF